MEQDENSFEASEVLSWLLMYNDEPTDNKDTNVRTKMGSFNAETLSTHSNIDIKGSIAFLNKQFNKHVELNGNLEKVLYIDKETEFRNLTIGFDSVDKIVIRNAKIDTLTITASEVLGFISFKNTTIKHLRIFSKISDEFRIGTDSTIGTLHIHSPIESTGRISFQNIRIGEILMKSVFNYGRIEFYNCSASLTKKGEPKVFAVKNSQLGNIVFDNFPFDQYDRYEFEGTNLSTIESYTKHFPVSEKYGFIPKDYALFASLSNAMSSINNKDQQFKYHVAHLEYWRKYLKEKNDNSFTRLVLTLNKLSSNYGESWTRPLLIIFLWGILPFYFYFVSNMEGVQIGWYHNSWEYLWVFVGKYFEFLWPTHKIDLLGEPGIWAMFDVIHRIINGYLIYQMISAFRRIGKL